MSKHYLALAASVLGAPRTEQAAFLQKRGWAQLVQRADVWFNPHRVGGDRHDVFTLRFAVIEAAKESTGAYRPKPPRVFHHAGAQV